MTSAFCCGAKMVIAMLAHVDLCSGIGGFALGFHWAGLSRPVLFCDIEEWSRKVLAKHWPDVPISDDVKELASDPGRLVPDCDILTAGYPCQPFSLAGKRRGEKDDRHIWSEIFAIVQAKRPRWCVFENVSGHINMGLDQVLSDLESEGYTVQPFVVPACAVDAPHRRDRVWIIAAHADSESQSDVTGHGEAGQWLGWAGNAGNAGCLTKGQWSVEGHRFADTGKDVADASREQNYEQRRVNERKWRTLGRSKQALQQEKWQAGADSTDRCGANVADARREGLYESRCLRNVEPKAEQQSRVRWDDASGGTKKEKQDVADAKSQRVQGHRPSGEQVAHSHERQGLPLCGNQRPATAVSQSQPSVGGVADGLSTWLDEPRDIPRVATGVKQRTARLKGLGNAIVPQIAMQIGLTIKAVENV